MRPLFGNFLSRFTESKISSTHFSAATGLSNAMYSAIYDTRSMAKGDQIIFTYQFSLVPVLLHHHVKVQSQPLSEL